MDDNELTKEIYGNGFRDGAIYVLEYLEEVFEEKIRNTDVWKDFFEGENE